MILEFRISVYDYYDENRKAVATYSPLCTDETWGNSGLELKNPNKLRAHKAALFDFLENNDDINL